LETWIFGAILAIVGSLVFSCSFGDNGLGIFYTIAGLASAGIGFLVFVTKFKQWMDTI